MSFDTKCYELAEAFLSDTPRAQEQDIDSLAQAIQDAIEAWFFEHRAKPISGDELTDLIRSGAKDAKT